MSRFVGLTLVVLGIQALDEDDDLALALAILGLRLMVPRLHASRS